MEYRRLNYDAVFVFMDELARARQEATERLILLCDRYIPATDENSGGEDVQVS